jgi:hypothetical protein
MMSFRDACLLSLVVACGGGQTARDDKAGGTGGSDDVPFAGDSGEVVVPADAGPPDATPEPVAPVVFRLVNTGTRQLSFNMNKGWQPVIFAWAGERGKNARPLVMFAKHCTASCDVGEEEICPYCPEPEGSKEERAAQKYQHVEAGQSLDVPWDGQAFAFEKAKGLRDGKKAKCECFRTATPEPAEYTVWACGIRLTGAANVASKPQCIEQKLTWPVAQAPQILTFEFPDPPPPDKGKKKGH